MNVIGIDYSITSPAVCIFSKGSFSFKSCRFYSLSDHKIGNFDNLAFQLHEKDYHNDVDRFERIAFWVLENIPDEKPENLSIWLEGYSMGSKGKVFNIAENAGILKYLLFKRGIDLNIVPPTVVKKFATGKGNSNKEAMYEAFVKETKIPLKDKIQPTRKLGSPTSDIIDAFYICKYGASVLD